MQIKGRTALITGAASGIGQAAAIELARHGATGLALIDQNSAVQQLASAINDSAGQTIAYPFIGNTTDASFRSRVFDEMEHHQSKLVTICVPAAGITRDALAVKIDTGSGAVQIYPEEMFQLVIDVNLLAPVYWALEMVSRIAAERFRKGLGRWEPTEKMGGTVIFIGSVSSQGNRGQLAYATTKRGLEGAASTLQKEGMYHGVKFGVIHPGFTDTPMVRALGEEYIAKNVLPYTQLRRLIRPEEIASAICFMIHNSAVSGELWADAGWHPSA